MLKPWSFFPCYWLLLSNYVAGTQGIQRAENMSGAIYKWWLFVYSLAWTSENIESGEKTPIKNTSSSQQISACICSFTWNVNVTADKFLFPHLLIVFSGSSEMKVSLKALISPWKLHFSCPQVTVFKNISPIFVNWAIARARRFFPELYKSGLNNLKKLLQEKKKKESRFVGS